MDVLINSDELITVDIIADGEEALNDHISCKINSTSSNTEREVFQCPFNCLVTLLLNLTMYRLMMTHSILLTWVG